MQRPLSIDLRHGLLALFAACSSGGTPGDEGTTTSVSGDPSSFPASTTDVPDPTATATGDTSPTTTSPTTDPTGDSTSGDPGEALCPTQFRFDPPTGGTAPRIAGEWQGFDLATATTLGGPDQDGLYTGTIDLPPGLHAYKIVYDQGGQPQWILDPAQGRRKYLGGTENSAVLVRDCRDPALVVATSAAAANGTYKATLTYVDGLFATGPDPAAFTATLRTNDTTVDLGADQFKIADDGSVTIDLTALAPGKHRVTVTAASADGRTADPLRLVFWIEDEPFTWDGALVYMVVTDRYRDGDPNNNPGPTPMADPRGDWQGGDLAGLAAAIDEGVLDELGVRAIWLTPFQTNPDGPYLASDGVHHVTGYHGYWPTRAREVEPRIGGAEALHAVVRAAHAHGIRILQDFVVNHIHEDHEYMAAHPEWFRTGCVCGTDGCDWTAHALDCMFAAYLPDINHSVPEANAAFVADAVWWLDEFDLDGLRVDAVKHVEEVATRNLAAAVRETFEPAGTDYFLMGETAMGWSDCPDPCNDENYGTIARYVGPLGLDGQFDFVLYHGVSYRTFAHGDTGMLHADYWTQHGLGKWPAGSVMTPYIGSHDTPRFVTMADYRGQDPSHDKGVPGNQWTDVAAAPQDGEPYRRMRIAMAWLLAQPGAPLLYYGDEYGQWGGADPNNRQMLRTESDLDADEIATLAWTRKLGQARAGSPALRRGVYVPLYADEDTLVFARKLADGDAALVGLTRAANDVAVDVEVTAALGFAAQSELDDLLGGAGATVNDLGKAKITIPAGAAVILAP